MKLLLGPGKYIIAVSGGVDSMVLLDMLHKNTELDLIVAHIDHGIREDSSEDADFVAGVAGVLGVSYESIKLDLGASASEDTARRHRYDFLRNVRKKHDAVAIVTAHHLDDRIETAAINTLRGTMRRGLVSLKETDEIKRPLLGMTKDEIRDYAITHRIEWREDSTNSTDDYLRNRVRGRLYGTITPSLRKELTQLLATIEADNTHIDQLIAKYLDGRGARLLRSECMNIDALVLYEIVAAWLRANNATFDKNTIVRICNGARNLKNGAKIDIDKRLYCQLTRNEIIITER